MFGPEMQFPTMEGVLWSVNDLRPLPVDRRNFLSQFFLASQAVIFANYLEVGSLSNVFYERAQDLRFQTRMYSFGQDILQ